MAHLRAQERCSFRAGTGYLAKPTAPFQVFRLTNVDNYVNSE